MDEVVTVKRVSKRASKNDKRAQFMATVRSVADGRPRKYVHRGNNLALADLPQNLSTLDALEWLCPFVKVERSEHGATIHLDQAAFAHYSRHVLTLILAPIRNELAERRHAYIVALSEARNQWVSDTSKVMSQCKILDWLEEQLEKLPDYYGLLAQLRSEIHQRRKDYWGSKNKSAFYTAANPDHIAALLDWAQRELEGLVNHSAEQQPTVNPCKPLVV